MLKFFINQTYILLLFVLMACTEDGLHPSNNQFEFQEQLSSYQIYTGDPSNLEPTADYHLYELGSTLFTDFAEKQRLIKLPPGSQMTFIDEQLPNFPEGTIIVKTFYYFNNKQNPESGVRIIETRLLVYSGQRWNVATYLWNEEQTDARLLTSGYNTSVSTIDENGESRVIAYHVPNNRECASCHRIDDNLAPIGPKIRNLNIPKKEGEQINQITHLQNLGILDGFDQEQVPQTPDFHNSTLPVVLRGRAYLDLNCGHCHNSRGFAKDTELFLSYESSVDGSNIKNSKDDIIDFVESGKMPLIGTSIVDEEGLSIIKAYLNGLE